MKKSRVVIATLAAAVLGTSALGLAACSKDTNEPENPTTTGVYTIKFDANEGKFEGDKTVTEVKTANGKVAALPKDPTRADYTFSKWTVNKDGTGGDVTASYTYTKDMTVYAQWTAASSDDQTGGGDDQTGGGDDQTGGGDDQGGGDQGGGDQGGGDQGGGDQGGGDETPTTGVYIGNTSKGTLYVNEGYKDTADPGSSQYWLGLNTKITLSAGETVSLYVDGNKISAYGKGSGVKMPASGSTADSFEVSTTGEFEIYLNHNGNGSWTAEFIVTVPAGQFSGTIPNDAAKSQLTFSNGTVTLYLQKDGSFLKSLSGYKLYMWDSGENKWFGEWPGTEMTETMNGASAKSINENITFIINHSSNGQTRNLSGIEANNTYVITFATGDGGKVEKVVS